MYNHKSIPKKGNGVYTIQERGRVFKCHQVIIVLFCFFLSFWSYNYIHCYGRLFSICFCSVLIYRTNISAVWCWCYINVPLGVTCRDKWRAGVGLFWKQIKLHLCFCLFEVTLVWHGCYGWVAQQIDLAGQGTRGRWRMGMDGWKMVLVACLWQQSQISALMAAPYPQHLPHPANLLAFQ